MATATIYKIRDRVSGKCYIGCTMLPLDVRVYHHQMGSGGECTAKQVMEHNTYEVEVLEKCAEDNRFERELHYINEFRDSVVNRVGVRAKREPREPRVKGKRNPYKKTDIQAESIEDYKTQYKQTHKNEIKAYNQDYYDANKERLTAKTTCGCGGRYCQLTKSTHCKTKKHLEWEMKRELEAFVQDV